MDRHKGGPTLPAIGLSSPSHKMGHRSRQYPHPLQTLRAPVWGWNSRTGQQLHTTHPSTQSQGGAEAVRSRDSARELRGAPVAPYFSLLARRRYSPTVIAFFWMLYCVNRPDWPVTTCWMGAGMTTSSMSSYVCRGFHSFGGMICRPKEASATGGFPWPVQASQQDWVRSTPW